MRLLSAEAKIKLADMRSGRMTDDDWTRLAPDGQRSVRRRSTSTTPRTMTMMEIARKPVAATRKPGCD